MSLEPGNEVKAGAGDLISNLYLEIEWARESGTLIEALDVALAVLFMAIVVRIRSFSEKGMKMDNLLEAPPRNGDVAVASLTVFVAIFFAVTPGFAQDCPGATDEGWDGGDLNLWIGFISTNVSAPLTGGNPGGYLEGEERALGQVVVGNESPPWSGDWVAGEIREISIDIKSPVGNGTTSLYFRVRRDSFTNGWFYDNFASLADDGQWYTFTAPISPTWSDAQAIAAGWWTSDTDPYYTFIETLTVMETLTFGVSTVPADNPIGFDNVSISCGLFADGFESGNTNAWSDVVGLSG